MVKERIIKLIKSKKFKTAISVTQTELTKGSITLNKEGEDFFEQLKKDALLNEKSERAYLDQRFEVFVKNMIEESEEITINNAKYYIITSLFIVLLFLLLFVSLFYYNSYESPVYVEIGTIEKSKKTIENIKNLKIDYKNKIDSLTILENDLLKKVNRYKTILVNQNIIKETNNIITQLYNCKSNSSIILNLDRRTCEELIPIFTSLLNKYKENPTIDSQEDLEMNIKGVNKYYK